MTDHKSSRPPFRTQPLSQQLIVLLVSRLAILVVMQCLREHPPSELRNKEIQPHLSKL